MNIKTHCFNSTVIVKSKMKFELDIIHKIPFSSNPLLYIYLKWATQHRIMCFFLWQITLYQVLVWRFRIELVCSGLVPYQLDFENKKVMKFRNFIENPKIINFV